MLAQLVEHVTFNDVADGSNPSQDTIFILKNNICGGSSVG
ncbi:hypothetical protein CBGD1_14 [Sulfurimonas gotlandica GD1]|nr:hypothetical protein CBGD1_14 [Sulfurimonas gotlandica GD1]